MGVIKGIIKKAFGTEEKQYTLGDAMRILKKEGNELYMPVPVEPGNPYTKYWIRKDESLIKDFPHVEINKSIKESPFQEKRARMMEEINYNVNNSHSTRPGRVTKYNDYQSARNYQKKYGPTR